MQRGRPGRELPAHRHRAPPRPVPAPAAGEEVPPPRGSFFVGPGCAPLPGPLMFQPAPRTAERHRKGTAPSLADLRRGCAKSFGSLKTEEKTERQCGQFVRGGADSVGRSLRRSCLSIRRRVSHPVTTHIKSDRGVAGHSTGPALDNQSFVAHRNRGGRRQAFVGEFDPGSGRTLAACLTHASRGRWGATLTNRRTGA